MHPDIENVIGGDYCVGCGACSVMSNSNISIKMGHRGQYIPAINPEVSQEHLLKASLVCPFSRLADNETKIAERVYGSQLRHSEYLGLYRNTYAGYAHNTREYGSSGGIITWLLLKLLDVNRVDSIITVGQTGHDNPRFAYTVLNDKDTIIKAAGSAYYPIKMEGVIEHVARYPGRYAFVGLPCFHKAIRLLRAQNQTINERIAYQIGLVCGHLKTSHYYHYLLRRVDLAPDIVKWVRFRKKNPQSHAGNYIFEATAQVDGKTKLREIENAFLGDNWGMGLFKPNACDFCDDIFAETADIVVMDAWLPEYIEDYRGTSLIVTRSEELDNLLQQAVNESEVKAERIDPDKVIQSQRGAIRHRRRGLKLRLHYFRRRWVPKKRIEPALDPDSTFRMMQRMRRITSILNNRYYLWQERIPGLLFYNVLIWPIEKIYFIIQKIHYKYGDNESYE